MLEENVLCQRKIVGHNFGLSKDLSYVEYNQCGPIPIPFRLHTTDSWRGVGWIALHNHHCGLHCIQVSLFLIACIYNSKIDQVHVQHYHWFYEKYVCLWYLFAKYNHICEIMLLQYRQNDPQTKARNTSIQTVFNPFVWMGDKNLQVRHELVNKFHKYKLLKTFGKIATTGYKQKQTAKYY